MRRRWPHEGGLTGRWGSLRAVYNKEVLLYSPNPGLTVGIIRIGAPPEPSRDYHYVVRPADLPYSAKRHSLRAPEVRVERHGVSLRAIRKPMLWTRSTGSK